MTNPSTSQALEKGQLAFVLIMLVAGYVSIAVSQIALGLALLLFLARWAVTRQTPSGTGLEKSALALAAWALVMIPFSTHPGESLVFYRRFYLFASIWVTASLADSESRRRMLFWALMIGAAGSSLFGAISFWVKTGTVFLWRLDTVFNAMTGGALLMMGAMVGIGFLLVPGVKRRRRLIIGAVLVPVVLGLFMTMTRSALLGSFFGIAAMVLVVRPKVFRTFLLIVVLALFFLAGFGDKVLSPKFRSRIAPEYVMGGKNTRTRVEMWRGGWEMVKAHPVTGVGDCDLVNIAPDYFGNEDTYYLGHMHSNPVQLAVIWGIPGFLIGHVFIIMGLWLLWRRWRWLKTLAGGPASMPVLAGWVAGAVGTWGAFYVAGFTEWYFGDAESMLIYLAILGAALGPIPDVAPAEAS